MASVLHGDFLRAIPVVSSLFDVRDYQYDAGDDCLQFLIGESDVRHKFPVLLDELAKLGMIATASKKQFVRWLMPTVKSARLSVNGGALLTVYRLSEQKKKANRLRFLPLALFFATLTAVFIDGLLKSDAPFATAVIHDPVMLAVTYTMSLMGILGIHELGHMIAAKHHGVRISWPYFLPNLPGIFSPTFGAMIRLRSNMPNRNAMFDVGISGPILGLIVTIIVSIYGSSISVLIPADEAQRYVDENQSISLDTSLLMKATMALTGASSEGMVLFMSPVLFAAWLGFFLTFLNLIPASQLDGGHIMRAALGAKYHRPITFAMIGAIFVLPRLVIPLFAPTFWIMGTLILIITLRVPDNPPLDDVTPLSKGRKAIFAAALAMAALCAPVPF